jgi:lipoprotein-releasing system ATP-binding protein
MNKPKNDSVSAASSTHPSQDKRSALALNEKPLPTSRSQKATVSGAHSLSGSGPHVSRALNSAQIAADNQLAAINLHKSYRKGSTEVPVLRGVTMGVQRGEFLAIVGQSGSGKSTLLHLLGTLDIPNRGEVHYGGKRIDNLPGAARDALRNHQFGMIFQFYHLLPELNTLEIILAPLMIANSTWKYLLQRRKHRCRAELLLEMVGLTHRLKHKPRELSGGEMQRAAIARALVSEPELLLADEPTGNLDQHTGQEIIKILRTLNREQNLTIVMVTHDLAIAEQADRIVRLADGRIEQ